MTGTFRTPRSYYDIPGFFWWLDRKLFSAVLEAQRFDPPGDIVELGTYMGKSAVILGDHLRDGERLVALDLFGSDAQIDEQNRRENKASYSALTRDLFERYYLSLHDELPLIVQGPSSAIVDYVAPDQARFVHVDASHLYVHVSEDVRSTKQILRPGGLAVFDDWRSEHTPGVSAAVWEAVFRDGFVPIAVTPMKLYGMFAGDPTPYQKAIRELVTVVDFGCVDEEVLGTTVMRISQRDKKREALTRLERAVRSWSDAEVSEFVDRTIEGVRTANQPEQAEASAMHPSDAPTHATVQLSRWGRIKRKLARA